MGKYWSSRKTAAIGAPSVPLPQQVAQRPEHRCAPQHEAALAGNAGRRDGVDERRGARRGPGRGASRRTRRSRRPAPRPPRPGGPRSACRPRRHRSAGPPRRRRPTTAASSAPTASAKRRARRWLGSCTATIDASMIPPSIIALRPSPCAQAMSPDPTKPMRSTSRTLGVPMHVVRMVGAVDLRGVRRLVAPAQCVDET